MTKRKVKQNSVNSKNANVNRTGLEFNIKKEFIPERYSNLFQDVKELSNFLDTLPYKGKQNSYNLILYKGNLSLVIQKIYNNQEIKKCFIENFPKALLRGRLDSEKSVFHELYKKCLGNF